MQALRQPTFRVALAALLWGIHACDPHPPARVRNIGAALKLSNHDAEGMVWLLTQEPLLRRARSVPWPTLQRVLIAPPIDEALTLAEATARAVDGHTDDIEYCRQKLELPRDVLNPHMLINGDDLRAAGFTAGPRFRDVLDRVRDAQLEARCHQP